MRPKSILLFLRFLWRRLKPALWCALVWLNRLVEWLAAPIVRNFLFVAVVCAIYGLCVWTQTQYEGDAWLHLQALLGDVYLLGVVLCLVPAVVRTWLRRALYVVIYAVSAFEVFLSLRFSMLYSPTALQLFAETNPQETGEFFAAYLWCPELWRTLGLFAAFAIVHWAIGRGAKRIQTSQFAHVMAAIAAWAMLPLVVWCSVESFDHREKLMGFFSERSSQTTETVKWEAFYTPVHRIAFSVHMLRLAEDELEVVRRHTLQDARVDSCAARCPNIVLVIGESYNKHHAGIYGHVRPTTPNMSAARKTGQLVTFTDVVTPWNLTSNVFKHLFSTHSLDQKGGVEGWCRGVLFPALFRRAGYDVAFITNQYVKHANEQSFDFNGSFFLNDPCLDSLCFSWRNHKTYRYDRDLLAELDLMPEAQRRLLILHLYGQHQKYSERVPDSMHHFSPDSVGRKHLAASKRRTLADYEDATLENDFVMGQLFARLDSTDAIVVYFADHGEQVYDRSNICGRTPADPIVPMVARNEFEVPFVVWMSRKFVACHADVAEAVRLARKRPFMTDDVCHMLLGLAGIACPQYEPKRDLLHPSFDATRPRLLKGVCPYDSVRYEHAAPDTKGAYVLPQNKNCTWTKAAL